MSRTAVPTETDEGRRSRAGVHVGRRQGESDLPIDVRRRVDGPDRSAVVVEAVLDALPSPTLLIDADGTVLLANTAWEKAADVLGDDRVRIGVDGDYFAMARRLNDRLCLGLHTTLNRSVYDLYRLLYLLCIKTPDR